MENGPDLSGLLGRLRRLEDMEAARNHLHRYAATLDAPTAESIAALFTEDGVLRTRLGEFTGREAIAGFYRDRLAADPSEKRHFIVSPGRPGRDRGSWRSPRTSSSPLAPAPRCSAGAPTSTGYGSGEAALFTDKTIEIHMGTDLAKGWARP